MRSAGPQRATYGDNYTVEWGKQKRGKESRGDDNVGGGRGSRGSAKAAADEEPASGQGGEDAADMDRGVVSILGGVDSNRGGGEATGETVEITRGSRAHDDEPELECCVSPRI